MVRPRQLLILIALVFLLSATGFAENKEKIKYLTPTLTGSTGLFNLYVADTLRQGEFSIGFNSTKFHREPGDLDFTIFPVCGPEWLAACACKMPDAKEPTA